MNETMNKPIILCIYFILVEMAPSQDHWETAIYADDVWSYVVPESELPSEWNTLDFDDSAWLSGPGGIGYGDGDGLEVRAAVAVTRRERHLIATRIVRVRCPSERVAAERPSWVPRY